MGSLGGGRYELLRLLGDGGMGQVWQARDHVMRREVAVKVMRAHHLDDRTMLRRFERELDLTARLQHGNVIRAYDRGWDDWNGRRAMYLVMELLDGMSLDARIGRAPQGGLALRDVIAWGGHIVRGLEAAHEAGLIHRDLKPSNVQITRRDEAVLLDFGIACLQEDQEGLTRITGDGVVVGTPPYMSPEQCRGSAVTVGSDLYSFGCVLYAMLTGRPPFLGPDVMRRHQSETPLAPQARRADVPDELDELVMDLLEKRPEKRPSPAAVRDRLNEVDPCHVRQEFRSEPPPSEPPPWTGAGAGSGARAPGGAKTAPPPPQRQQPSAPAAVDPVRADIWGQATGASLLSGVGVFGLLCGVDGTGVAESVVWGAVVAGVLLLVGVATAYATGNSLDEVELGCLTCLSALGWLALLVGCVWLTAARGDFPWYYDFLVGLGLSVGVTLLLAGAYGVGENTGLSPAAGVLTLLCATLLGTLGSISFAVHEHLVWWATLLSGLGLAAAAVLVVAAFYATT
ncbi:serine/threonine-protein kinase [Streptomyces sp. 7R007]